PNFFATPSIRNNGMSGSGSGSDFAGVAATGSGRAGVAATGSAFGSSAGVASGCAGSIAGDSGLAGSAASLFGSSSAILPASPRPQASGGSADAQQGRDRSRAPQAARAGSNPQKKFCR